MVKPVDRLVGDFIEAGRITSPSTQNLPSTCIAAWPDSRGRRKPGIVFNPATPLDVLSEVIDLVDLVLIMSVNPGLVASLLFSAVWTNSAKPEKS